MKKKYVLILFFSCLIFTIQAQKKKRFGKVPITRNIKGKAKSFKAISMFSELKAKPGTDLKKTKSRKDKLGINNTSYQQYHNGIKVEFGKLKLHGKTRGDSSYNVGFYDVSEVNVVPRLSEKAAFERTKGRIKADTRFSGSQNINTYDNNGTHVLMDDSRTSANGFPFIGLLRKEIITLNVNNVASIASPVDFTDTDNNWTSAEHDNADMNGQTQNTDINNIMNPNIGKGKQF